MEFDDIVAAGRFRLDIDADTDTEATNQLGAAVNRAYRRLVAKYRLEISDGTASLVADQNYITLPTGFLRILSVRIGTTRLRRTTPERFADFEATGDEIETGTPVWFTDKPPTDLWVTPTPDADETDAVAVRYVPLPATLSGTDEPELIPEGYHELLLERAVAFVAPREGLPDEAASATLMADRLEAELGAEIRNRAGIMDPAIVRKHYG